MSGVAQSPDYSRMASWRELWAWILMPTPEHKDAPAGTGAVEAIQHPDYRPMSTTGASS